MATRAVAKAHDEQSASSWWCGAVSSETELLSAAVLCAAIANCTRAPSDASASTMSSAEREASRRELEALIRSSPLPHKLQTPVIEYTSKYVVVESASAVICAVRATNTGDIVEAVLGSTVPLAQPYVYRYGGARIHLPFWKRAQQLDMGAMYRQARARQKMLLLCGHSIAGSIAQIGMCEFVYQQLPPKIRASLEKLDVDAKKQDAQRADKSTAVHDTDPWRGATLDDAMQNMPHVMAMGFGSPYISSHALQRYLNALGMTKRMVTLVNEHDCIPGILNVAQSAAMVTKTTERFLTITKATKSLLKFLPARMQSVFVAMNAEKAAGAGLGSATSAYVTMSLSMLQNAFHKFRELDVIKEVDYQYSPCGTYLYLKKADKAFQLLSDSAEILKVLRDDEAATALTGNAILQHLMSAYVDAVARRSTSIQINETMNYYERLGVEKNATPRQIRSAYKTLALKWHPDRWSSAATPNEQQMAENVFKLLAEAYEVLSDPEARAAYDAHLSKGPSWVEEFVREGSVGGMTLDEAIATFSDVLDGATGAVSHVTSRFTSSSSSSVVGQARIRRVEPLLTTTNGLAANNHNNLFAPDRIRVARQVGVGAEQQEKILFVQPEELLSGDVAAPALSDQNATGAAAGGLKTVSVLGGAVVVGASVALAVTAWNQYSESAKRSMQADAVRKMPGEYLMLLVDDHRAQQQSRAGTIQRIDAEAPKRALTADNQQSSVQESALVERENGAIVPRNPSEQEDDDLVDEFFDCLTGYEEAKLEAFTEDEFYECVDIMEEVAAHFKPALEDKPATTAPVSDVEAVGFPVGSKLSTPFGLGTVVDWRHGESAAVIALTWSKAAYIQKDSIARGASHALTEATASMEKTRLMLSERVIERYGLEKTPRDGGVRGLVQASKEGALDSGMRAAGGVVLAKGMSRATSSMSGVAAPLAIASILVDIGKDYYEYRSKQAERKNLGMLSAANERLMMRDFRLKAGQHVVSGTTAAAGASLGAYSVASAVGFWTGVGITGPIGVVAATGAAVVGGMLGFFAGSKAYTGYTSSYFTNFKTAKEQIDRLELGARILFNEHDPTGSGEISKADCVGIISKLHEASGSVSESGYAGILSVLQDDRFEGPVAWPMFWEWVSTEAARSLRKLEEEEAIQHHHRPDVEHESWWQSYKNYFSYGNAAASSVGNAIVASTSSAMYPSVQSALKFDAFTASPSSNEDNSSRIDLSQLVVQRAQMEYLVNAGCLTESDAFQLEQLLTSEDETVRESARRTIEALHQGELDAASTTAEDGGIISEGFFGDDTACSTAPEKASKPEPAPVARRERSFSQEQAQMDVFCSLLSTNGLQHYLHAQHIEVTPETAARHEDLHCLALLTAAPPPSTTTSL